MKRNKFVSSQLVKYSISFLFLFNTVAFNSFSQPANTFSDFKLIPKINWVCNYKYSFYASPIAKDNTVYIGGLDSILHAIDINTGIEKWKFKTKGEIRSNVCINSDDIYLNGGDGSIYCLNADSGKLIWEFTTKGEKKYDFADYFHSTPVLNNEMLFFGSGRQ